MTITFNTQGGTPNPAPRAVNPGSAYGALPAVSRTGFKFDGWYTAATGGTKVESATKAANAANHTLYARWTAVKSVTVTFNTQGGTPNPAPKAVTVGSPYGALPTVSKPGYKFNNWLTTLASGAGDNRVFANTTVANANNHTLYAEWAVVDFKVTFNVSGGSAPSPASTTVPFGSAYGALPAVSRTGFNFDGWFTAATGGTKVDSTTKVANAANHTLYARWTAVSAPAPAVYSIGGTGPAGGVIFYAQGGKYLECSSGEVGGKVTWDEAEKAVRNFSGGGKTDWRLPTREEMGLMYNNLHKKRLGGFKNEVYWYSLELEWFHFGVGASGSAESKTVQCFVRAVRSF